MSWRDLITGIYENRPRQQGIAEKPEFYPAASHVDIANAESALDGALPASLRSLLLETNGVMDMMAVNGGEWFSSMWLLWSTDEIVERNCFYRTAKEVQTCMRDFRNLIFFAGAGSDGILFAFPVEDGVAAPRVVVWHPILNELNDAANCLDDFLRGWLTGKITV